MKLQILPRAQAQVRSKRAWWVENRPDAPKLFDEELERAIELLRETPGAGVVVVLAVWGAARGRGPRL